MMNIQKEECINGYIFSTDKKKLNADYIQQFLSKHSYWAIGIPKYLVERSIENSLCFGIYDSDKQIGFARLVTDYATFGYLGDVFVDTAYRGKGLSKNLMKFIFSIPELKIFRRIVLATRDAHSLYAQYNFKPLNIPERFMEIYQPNIYQQLNEGIASLHSE